MAVHDNIPLNNIPLAERMRPKSLSDYMGQDHLVSAKGTLKATLESGLVSSMILWGPPGTGKTTLANIIAHSTKRQFFTLSAVDSGVAAVREIINKAKNNQGLFTTTSPILFIDEIHRFSKSQQDALLGAVEKGTITLIGATTENPSFEVIPALLSRCQVFTLKYLTSEELKQLLQRALKKDQYLKSKKISIKEYEALITYSGGDARKLLNIFEQIVLLEKDEAIIITNKLVEERVQTNMVLYDKNGEQHYDIISAFIKSIRGSDPQATVYWLARMVEGGEDIKFIARRLIISAAEDIGLANPTALVIANNAFQAATNVGYPEASIILSECAIYLACSPKSNASYLAIKKAQEAVRQKSNHPVPLHLRNAPTTLMKELDYGKYYKYAHDYTNHFIAQEYLPEDLSGTCFYEPAENTKEKNYKSYLNFLWGDKYKY